MTQPSESSQRNAVRIAAGYAALSLAWIFGSDWLVEQAAPAGAQALLQNIKGVAFVLVTALVLYLLLRAVFGRIEAAARRLNESEARFRALIENVSDLVSVVDANGNVLYASPARGIDFPDDPRDAVGGSFFDHLEPDDRERARTRLDELVRQPGGHARFEFRLRDADGRWRHFESAAHNLIDDPAVGGIVVATRDITERHRASERLRALVEQSLAGIYVIAEGRIEYINPRIAQMFGYQAEALFGRELIDYVHPDDRAVVAQNVARRLSGELASLRYSVRLRHREGHYRMVEVEGNVIEHEGRKAIMGVLKDVTEQHRAEADLRLAAKVYESSREGILITDADRRIVSVNRAFTEITGYSPEEVIGGSTRMLRSGRHDEAFYQAMWRELNETGHWQGEIWDRRKDGTAFPAWLRVIRVQDAQDRVTHFIAVFSDITESKAYEERIEHLAHHDALTGLPNRLVLADRLDQAIARARRESTHVAVVFFDLDRFKNINDSLGHAVGDRLLVEASRRLAAAVRATDTVSRNGGDEFVMLLPDLESPQGATRVAHAAVAALAQPFRIDGRELSISASAGISVFPSDGEDAETLLRNADAAMYHAKASGRNNCQFYTARLNREVTERLVIENGLRRALREGELRLAFQPKVAIENGRVTGAEALLRWRSSELGEVTPGRFIPVAEETGLIVPIGQWVLAETCRQLRAWRDAGVATVPVGVNLSAVQFRHPDLVEGVLRALEQNGIEPGQLTLEVTESMILRDVDKTTAALDALRARGVRVALDDFGTGYSSLSYLARFHVDEIKIDAGFIRQLLDEHTHRVLVQTIVDLGHHLGCRVVAEGVETDPQRAFLRHVGCDELQGWIASRALPPHEFSALLSSGKRF